jgi:hypothetical protein
MTLGNKSSITASEFRPLRKNVFVTDLDSGMHVTAGGIIRPDDNMSETGIRSRWARVWAIGPEVEDLTVGEWIFVEHARWTNSIDIDLPSGRVRVWKVDWPNAVMLASPDDPREAQLSSLPRTERLQAKNSNVRSLSPAIIRNRNQ